MDGLTSPSTFLYGIAATALVLATYKRVRNRSRLPKPPGPKGYPIIGNLFDVPSKRSWIGYKELSEKYGDMVYLEVFGQPILVLSTLKRIHDLFEKRSNIYSDRPQPPMLVDLMDLGGYMTVMPYGTRLNRHRKMFRQHIESNDISKWYPIIRRQVFDCMKAVAAIPDSWNTHFNHLFTSMMVEITYGVKTKSLQDPFIKDMMEAALGFAQAALPGSFLVDTFPILKYVPTWFPGAYFKRFAAYYKAVDYKARNDPKFDHVTRAMKAGTSRPCVVSSMVEALPEENDPTRAEEETIARNVAAMIHAAGSDTTRGTAVAFLLFMALNPEVQRKAQEELDRVVGYGRMPEFSDKESLVYVNAIVKELGRSHQTTPMALPHRLSANDVYDGYFIPKGTVMGNAWQILHDPETFEDPFAFKPERYIKDGKVDDSMIDASAAAFGFGRRICPGRFMSDETLFYTVACTLAMFDIVAPTDENGKPTIKYGVTDGALSHPEPFECASRPRSKEIESYLRSL